MDGFVDDEEKKKAEWARQQGIDEAEIQRLTLRDRAVKEAAPKRKGNMLTDAIPLVGGVLGGIAGAPLGGVGAIGGGAVGSAAGEYLRQKLVGEDTDLTKVGMEGALGLGGGVVGKVGGKLLSPVAKSIGGLAQGTGKNIAAKTLQAAFNVTPTVGERFQAVSTAKEMLKHPIPMTPGGFKKFVDSVTGRDGAMSEMVSAAIERTKGGVNIVMPVEAAANALEVGGALDGKAAQAVVSQIRRMMPTQGGKIGTVRASQAFDAVQKLEKTGFNLLKKADKFGEGNAAVYKDKGTAFLDAADTLMSDIERVVDAEGAFAISKTPERLGRLQSISSDLFRQAGNAQSLRDLRAIQRPFVNASKLMQSGMNRQEGTMGGRLGTGGAAAITGSLGFAAGGLPGAIGGALMAPAVEAVADTARFPVLSAMAKGASKLSSMSLPAPGKVASAVGGQVGARAMLGSSPEDTQAFSGADDVVSPQLGATPGQTQMGGITREQVMKAMQLDLAATGGKNFDKIEKMYKFSNPQADLPAAALTKVASLQTANNLVDEIGSALDDMGLANNPTQRISGSWRNFAGSIGFDSDASSYNAFREAAATTLAKALGNSGNLTEQEQQRALNNIPKITDTYAEAQKKLKRLKSIIKQSQVDIQSLSKYNVSGGSVPATPDELTF